MPCYHLVLRRPLPPRPDIMAFLTAAPENDSAEEDLGAPSNRMVILLPGTDPVRVELFNSPRGNATVSSKTTAIAARVAYFVAVETQGSVAGKFSSGRHYEPKALLPFLGSDFDVAEAFHRVEVSRTRLPAFFARRWPCLSEFVPGELTRIRIEATGRQLLGASTHPNAGLSWWVGKGYEGFKAFATEEAVPDPFFASLLVRYVFQEWAFALWNWQGRRFWFGAPVMHVACSSADLNNQMEVELKSAIAAWQRERLPAMAFMSGDRVWPRTNDRW